MRCQGHNKGSKCQWMFIQPVSSEPLNYLWPNLVWWCVIMSLSGVQKDWCANFNVFEGSVSSELLIFFATEISFMVCHNELEYLERKLDGCVQGQGHSEVLKCQWMFVQPIPLELLNLLWPNLVWLCIIMSWCVCQKDWSANFKVMVTVRACIIKVRLFLPYL